MSPEQCRAARAWLNWSQEELATKAQLSNSTLRDFEAGRRIPIANNLAAIRRALEDAGMQFLFSQEGGDKPWGVATRESEINEERSAAKTREATQGRPNRDKRKGGSRRG